MYDDLPFEPDDTAEHRVLVIEREPRKCRRHDWWKATTHVVSYTGLERLTDLTSEIVCRRCGKPKDEAAARRGRSSRRLGGDGERRSEKRYGWRKVGEFGGIDDLVGKLAIVQQKTTRSKPPVRWKSIFAALEGRAAGRIPLLLLSYVAQGKDTEDFIVIRGQDWLALHGRDEA